MGVPIQAIRIESEWNGAAISARHWITIHLIDRGDAVEIRVHAPLYGSPLPPTGPVGPTDALWTHEVVEVFFFGANDQYTEIELAPSGHHLVLQLNGIRNPVATKLEIQFESTVHSVNWTGTAHIPKALLPPGPHRVNATAIHGEDEHRRYLSWIRLPGDAPDFHQPDCSLPLQFSDDQTTPAP